MTATRPVPAPDFVGYPEVRRHVRALLDGRPGTHRRPVPACPKWTVTDLLEHVLEKAEGVFARLGGTLPPREGPLEVPGLLDRWDELGDDLDRRLADAGGRSGDVLVMDAYTHELDLRAALGVPPPVEHLAWAPSFEVLVRGFSGSVAGRGLPPVRLRTTGGST
ncbi:maleylpyruvate isomerase N-terminal domain-containing protein, partial [Amycolatopsis sp. SID8362]|uniref:maleylpyruvate isomerase N-terminal domain-containing protein n=1 Tax=Amycolatopsis sp. SID8362 TaxID=2690346 RepID=UPI0013693D01